MEPECGAVCDYLSVLDAYNPCRHKEWKFGVRNNESMMVSPQNMEAFAMTGKSEGILVGHCILDAMPSSTQMVRTASGSGQVDAVLAAVKAFASILETLSATSRIPQESVGELAKTAGADSEVSSRDVTIKIASTTVRDSHYFMDVSLDPIKKADKSLVMVSFLLREGYLGRYMIKRCFYYLPSNVKEAKSTYEEIVRKSEGVKKRYLQGEARPFDVLPQVKAFLDGIRGDFEFKDEDSLGTTVKRDREGYHAAEGPPYVRMA